jgi:hypothetical protein
MDSNNENKRIGFQSLFKQKSFSQFFNSREEIDTLFSLLSEDEVNRLVEMKVIFVRCSAPSTKVNLKGINTDDELTLITVDTNYYSKLLPEEFIGVLLHEIGHVFNPEIQGIQGEFAADNFAKSKGYAKWIISGLVKGVKNNWMGFEENSCNLRIENIKKNND